jgi:chemotaxis protein histidine kinase CheA
VGPEHAAGGDPKAGKRSWKGWGASKMQKMKSKYHDRKRGSGSGSQDGSAVAGVPALPAPTRQQAAAPLPPSLGASPSSPAALMAPPATAEHSPHPAGQAALAAAVAALSSEAMSLESIIEAKWMQSRKIQVPPAIAEVVVQSSSRHGSTPTSPRGIPRPSSQPVASEPGSSSGAAMANGGSAAGSQGSEGFTTPAGGSPVAPWRSPVGRVESSPARLGALPPGSPLGKLPLPLAPGQEAAGEEGGSQAGDGDAPGSGATASAAASQPGFSLPEGLPPLISPDYAVNAFLTRVLFDMLRRPDFQEHVRVRIQRQLSRLQRPDYIQTLEVVGVDCGGTAPTLRGLRALPQPSAAVWPQLLFDMRYQGAFTVTIEAKVDIRDAAAWEKFDAALSRFGEGRKRRSSGTARSGQTPTHTSSAPALGGSGSSAGLAGEEDDEEPEPLSPDSSAGLLSSSAGEHAGGSPGAEPPHGAEGSANGGSQAPEKRGFMGGLRQGLAKRVRQLAETTAVHIARIPLRLSVTVSLLEGTMVAWVPPPPGNRLFYSFVAPPRLELSAKPELAGRLLKYSYHIARVSSWIEQRMRAAITKTMVFPGGGDLLLLPLMGLEHPNAGDPMPALGRYMQQAATLAQQQREEQRREEQQAADARDKEQQLEAAAAEHVQQHGPAEGEPRQLAAASERQQQPPPERPLQAALPSAGVVQPQPTAAGAAGSAAAVEPQRQPAADAPPQAAAPQASPAAAVQSGGGLATGVPTGGSEAGEQWSESQETLLQEPSLSNLPSPQQAAAAAAARAATAAAGRPGSAGAAAASNGHLTSQRFRSSSEGGERVGSPGFQGWPAASAARAAELRASGGRSAEDAWDAAMALEAAGSAREAPTPKFGSGWQSAPGSAGGHRAAVDASRADSLPVDPLGALQQQRGAAAAGLPPSDPLPVPAPRPGLQLHLAATRSLDPDFTTSAERTGFGESPVTALPDYSSVSARRTLSAAPRPAGASGFHPGSADSVGASLNRSLEYLRRQSISSAPGSPAQQQQHDAGNLGTAPSPRPQQPPVQQAAAIPQQQQQQQVATSPPQDRGGSPSDNGRMRQQGSFKEQAGKLITRMNTAGKALASQMQQMQQQRAAQRASGQASGSGSGRRSTGADAPSPLRDGL